MAKVKIQGNASGTGILTVTAPNTSTDRTITLPDSTGTLATTADTGVAGITSSADATAMTITSAEKIGIGTGSPSGTLHINSTGNTNATTTYITRGDGTNNLPASIDTQTSLMLANSSDTYSNFLSIQAAPTGISGINLGDSADENIGQIGYYNNGDTMRFKVGATEKMRLTSDGLTFNGDTAAANALDDYEEGTFTPKAGDNSTNMQAVHNASYVKIGKLVTCDIDVQYPNSYSGSNGHMIYNLPFTTGSSGNGGGVIGYVDANDVVPAFHISGASTSLYFLNLRTGNVYTLSGRRIIFSVTYHIP